MIIIVFGEAFTHILYALPAELGMKDPEAFKAMIAAAPASMHLIILANYALACFLGALVAASIANDKKMNQAISLGGIFMGVGMFNLVSFSHPVWVIVVSAFVFIPAAYLGGKIAVKRAENKKKP
jgi:hypothetical protein